MEFLKQLAAAAVEAARTHAREVAAEADLTASPARPEAAGASRWSRPPAVPGVVVAPQRSR